jgi:glycosyltransferase involved in cell wall biosynthesis
MSIAIIVNADLFFLTHRKNLGLALQREGWKVYVLAPQTKKEYVAEIESLGFIFREVIFKRSSIALRGEYKTFRAIRKTYKSIHPDLVMAVGLKAILWGGIAARISRIPLVSAVSGLGFLFTDERNSLKQRILIQTLKFLLPKRRHHVVFQNNDDKEIFVKNRIVAEKHSSIIGGMGVDMNEYFPMPLVPKPNLRFLFPARMLKDKGLIEFIEAAKIFGEKYPNMEFVLAGDLDTKNPTGISGAALQKMIAGTAISWIGFQKTMIPVYQESDVVVLPSYREGFPKALIEACAIGRPVIATDVPGCRDCVANKINGFLIPVKNVDKLCEAMLKFWIDKNLIYSMGNAAAQLALQKFDSRKINEQFMAVFKEVVGS